MWHKLKLYLTCYLKETSFNVFANRADPNRAALVRTAWSGSTLLLSKYDISDPIQVDLTSNFFVLCTKTKYGRSEPTLVNSLFYKPTWKFIYIIIHSGWSLLWIFMKEMVNEQRLYFATKSCGGPHTSNIYKPYCFQLYISILKLTGHTGPEAVNHRSLEEQRDTSVPCYWKE